MNAFHKPSKPPFGVVFSGDPFDLFCGQAREWLQSSISDLHEELGKVQYGLGSAAELLMKGDSLVALATGSKLQPSSSRATSNLALDVPLFRALLFVVGTLLYFCGAFMLLSCPPAAGSQGFCTTGKLLVMAASILWIARAALLIKSEVDAHRERKRVLAFFPAPRKQLPAPWSPTVGVAIHTLRALSALLGLLAPTLLLASEVCNLAFASPASYYLGLLSALCFMGSHVCEGIVQVEVHSTAKTLLGPSQRLRAMARLAGTESLLLASVFVVCGAVTELAGGPCSQRFVMVGAIFMVINCAAELVAAVVERRLGYGDWPSLLTAQLQLDMNSVPTVLIAAVLGLLHRGVVKSRAQMDRLAGVAEDITVGNQLAAALDLQAATPAPIVTTSLGTVPSPRDMLLSPLSPLSLRQRRAPRTPRIT